MSISIGFTAGTDERRKMEDVWLVYRGQEG